MEQKKYKVSEGLLKMIHNSSKINGIVYTLEETIQGEKAKYETNVDNKTILKEYKRWLKNRTFRENLNWELSFWWKVTKYIVTLSLNYEGIPLLYPKRRMRKWKFMIKEAIMDSALIRYSKDIMTLMNHPVDNLEWREKHAKK